MHVKATQTRSFCYELYKLYTFIFYHNDDSWNLLFNMLYVIEATRSDGRRDRATVTSETLTPTHNVFFGPLSLNPSLAPGAGGRVGPPAPSTLPLGAPACLPALRPDPEGGTRNRNRHFPLSCSPSLPLNKKLSPRILPTYLFAVEGNHPPRQLRGPSSSSPSSTRGADPSIHRRIAVNFADQV